MDNKIFISASDVAKAMDISIGHAYKLVRQMNDELKKSGLIACNLSSSAIGGKGLLSS